MQVSNRDGLYRMNFERLHSLLFILFYIHSPIYYKISIRSIDLHVFAQFKTIRTNSILFNEKRTFSINSITHRYNNQNGCSGFHLNSGYPSFKSGNVRNFTYPFASKPKFKVLKRKRNYISAMKRGHSRKISKTTKKGESLQDYLDRVDYYFPLLDETEKQKLRESETEAFYGRWNPKEEKIEN